MQVAPAGMPSDETRAELLQEDDTFPNQLTGAHDKYGYVAVGGEVLGCLVGTTEVWGGLGRRDGFEQRLLLWGMAAGPGLPVSVHSGLVVRDPAGDPEDHKLE